MGIKGLTKWLAATGCNQDLSKHSPLSNLRTDHLLIDMNGLLHQAYDVKDPSLNRTIARTIEKVRQVIDKFLPHKSLTLVFDGFAPLSKLQTQKERRAGQAIVEAEFVNVKRNSGENNTTNGLLGKKSNSSDTGATDRILAEGEITAGSPYMLIVEEAIVDFVKSNYVLVKEQQQQQQQEEEQQKKPENDDDDEKPSATTRTPIDFYVSPSTFIGEGEVKISLRLHQLASSNSASDDNIIIFGSDSDLILVGLLAVQFHNIWVVHPSMNYGTSIGYLLMKWLDAKNVDCLMIDQLPSARIDFCFLMLLSGGDFYTGIEEEAIKLWNKYRTKRSSPHAYHKRLIVFPSLTENENENVPQIVAAVSSSKQPAQQQQQTYHQHQPRLDPQFFAQVVGGRHDESNYRSGGSGGGGGRGRYQQQKGRTPNQRMKQQQSQNKRNGPANTGNAVAQGSNVVSFALWALELLMMGRCEALGVAPAHTQNEISLASLQAFGNQNPASVAACRPRRTAITGLTSCVGLERPPIFTFVAVSPRINYLPWYVQEVLNENVPLRTKLLRSQQTTANIIQVTDEVLSLVKAHVAGKGKELGLHDEKISTPIKTELEKLLLSTPDPTLCEIVYSTTTNTTNNNNKKISISNLNKSSQELITDMTEIWKFEYPTGSTLRFRGIDKFKNEIVVNVVEKKKKQMKGKEEVVDDEEFCEEEEEEEEYDD